MKPGTSQRPVIALDLGGTWFRSALLCKHDDVQELRTQPAIGRSHLPLAPAELLQRGLVDYILGEVRLRREGLVDREGTLVVGISLGAAINARTKLVIASAPLWGPDAPVFDLGALLRAAEPNVRWTVVNDVSAAAMAFAAAAEGLGVERVAALAVGTGIALRTIDVSSRHIATDPVHGLQGEVGHLPAGRLDIGAAPDMRCDCGAFNHISSFVSGAGLRRVLAAHGDGMTLEEFSTHVRAGEQHATQLLDTVTRPLARVLLDQAVLDPACELVALCGGVVDALSDSFRHSLLCNLDELGMYGVSDRDTGFFRRRLVLAPPGAHLALRGAGAAARREHESATACAPADIRRGRRGWTVRAQRPVTYQVRVVPDLLNPDNRALAEAARGGDSANATRRVVVIDWKVDELWGERIRAYFVAHGIAIRATRVRCSEQAKTMERVFALVQTMRQAGVARRSEPLIVFGGGIVMDVVGLATSLYRRGVPYVRVPTTLIGQIDAGVGVKTAVNFEGNKSQMGAYHAPDSALLDPGFLRTLERRELSNGLAEIVKIALVKDAGLFDEIDRNVELLLETAFACAPGRSVTARAIEAMLGELEPNLWESDLERLADFGHAFSPAFEMHERPPLLHGEAVAIDMALSCTLSFRRGWLAKEELARILDVLERCGLPVYCNACRGETLRAALAETTLHRDGRQRLPLPTSIGEAVFVNDVTAAELDAAVLALARSANPATAPLAGSR